METRQIDHADHTDTEANIDGIWAVIICNCKLETKMNTTYYTLYETRGELLDTAADAAINERPFYLSAELADINDQIKLIEHITDEAQAEYFATTKRPTYDELLSGAKFTNEHRQELHDLWNKTYRG